MCFTRICIATPEYLPSGSGIAIACSELATGLRQTGIQVDVLSSSANADIQIKKVRNFSGVFGLASFWYAATKYLSENQDDYDIIWMHEPFFLSFNGVKNIKRIAITIHTTYYGFNSAFDNSQNQLLRLYYSFTSKLESAIFKSISGLSGIRVAYAITPVVASETNMNGLKRPLQFLPNCIDPAKFKIYEKDHARKMLSEIFQIQFPEDCKILLYIGRIDEVKRIDYIINIFQAISAHDPSLQLLLVGGGPQFNLISLIAAHNKNIHVLGNIDRKLLELFYSAADAFISLSRYEGLSMTLLEASHYGLPLILSDIPAHRWFKRTIIHPCKLVSLYSLDPKGLVRFINVASSKRTTSSTFLPKLFHTQSVINTFLEKF